MIGGCRSGKSTYALDQANLINGKQKIFVATSVPTDSEMEKRVKKHQQERGPDWQTIEEPLNIQDIINRYSTRADVILVDCLTLWASNVLFQSEDPDRVEPAIGGLVDALKKSQCPIFLVSNEVGMGIVPENTLARQFRDLAGLVNQRIAKVSDRVVMTVAGIEVQIKPGS